MSTTKKNKTGTISEQQSTEVCDGVVSSQCVCAVDDVEYTSNNGVEFERNKTKQICVRGIAAVVKQTMKVKRGLTKVKKMSKSKSSANRSQSVDIKAVKKRTADKRASKPRKKLAVVRTTINDDKRMKTKKKIGSKVVTRIIKTPAFLPSS